MTKKQRTYLSDMGLITLILSLFFGAFLGAIPLHTPDEARYSLVSFQLFQNHQLLIPQINGVGFLDKPPLFYYAQILMLKLFGNSEVSLRLPSVIASILSCLMLYITARKLFNRTTALSSVLILANFPLYFAMSHYANLDMMVASLINSALCFFILAQEKTIQRKRFLMWGCYLSMALAMLTKGLIAVAFPCCITFIYCVIYKIKPKLFLIEGCLLFLAIVLPWFLMMHVEINGFSYYYFVIQHFYRYLSQSFNNQQPVWFYAAILLACSLPWALFLTRKSLSLKNSALGFFVINFLFILLFFSLPSSKPLGYILPAFPPLALLLGHNLNQIKHTQRFTLISMIAIIVGLFFCYPWEALRAYFHEIMPLALTLTISGCMGLLIELYFASPSHHSALQINLKKRAFISLIGITLLFLNLNAWQFVQSLEHESILPITHYLKANEKNNAPVAMYQTFYYDLPYYAPQRTILAVDEWKKGLFKGDLLTEQFALGMQHHAPKTFISNAEFMKRWHNKNKLMYAVTNQQHSQTLLKQNGQLLLSHHGIYLLRN